MKLDELKAILNGLPEYKNNEEVKIRFHAYTMKRKFEWGKGRYYPEIDGDDPDVEAELEIKQVDPNRGWSGVFIEI